MWYHREKKDRAVSPDVDNPEFIARKVSRKRKVGYSPFCDPQEEFEPEKTSAEKPLSPEPGTPEHREMQEIKDKHLAQSGKGLSTNARPQASNSSRREQSESRQSGRHSGGRTESGRETGPRRLGQMLIKYKLISQSQLDEALAYQKSLTEHKLLGQVLVDLGFITEMQLTIAIAKLCQIPFLQITKYNVNDDAIEKLPANICRRYEILPLDILGNIITIAMVNPFDYNAVRDVEFHSGMKVKRVICLKKEMEECLERYYPGTALPEKPDEDKQIALGMVESPEEATIDADLDNIFAEAEEKIRTSLIEKQEIEEKMAREESSWRIITDRENLATNPSQPGIELSEEEAAEIQEKAPLFKFEKRVEGFSKVKTLGAVKVFDEEFDLVSTIIQ